MESEVVPREELKQELEQELELEEQNITATILAEIQQEAYVCLVCTCEITPSDALWSCAPCHRVYHLDCISHWSLKGSSTDTEGRWNCPSCNHTHKKTKFQYKCWCGKSLHPPADALNPGSCGQTCGARLKGCVHRCTLPCHPGPHAACNSLGPVMKCHCGKHDNQWPCVMTPYKNGWYCEDPCDEDLPCEIHKCPKVCHEGLCGKCQTFVESSCYCGQTKDMIKCHVRKPVQCQSKDGAEWIGTFQCLKKLEVLYDCNIHHELIKCAKPALSVIHCPSSPDLVKSCHCGKTLLASLKVERTSCTDPIPTCDQKCGKKLPCGHECQAVCHDGPCGTCYQVVDAKCECQLHQFSVSCKFNQAKLKPKCSNKCFASLSCRRHYCEEICCKDYKTAQLRERERKRALKTARIPDIDDDDNNSSGFQLNTTFNIEATHICLKSCGRQLRCGNPDHKCKQTCHSGPCATCLESSSEDLVCHCGDTVVPAPVRCGTRLPACNSQCQRQPSCGHDPMPHNCHEDNRPCPKCTKTVEKWCNCQKKKMNAMCFQKDVFCLERCGKKLPCLHNCSRSCHSGKCTDVKCPAICGKKKPYCSHLDMGRCHFPSRCDAQKKRCGTVVQIKCKCGRIVRNLPCGASSDTPSCEGNVLGCEASCIVKQREEQLREAFGIESAAAAAAAAQVKAKTVADIPYDLENIVKVAGMQIKWCLSIEEIFTQFMKNQTAIRYDFKPMITDKRRFIHYLAEAYGLESEAQDPEPFRSVSVRKTITSRVPPMKLFESVKIYQSLRRSTATTTPASSSSVKKEEPCVVESNAILIKDTIEGTDKELQESIEYLVNPKFQHAHNLHSLKFPEVSASHALKKITDGTDYLLYVPSDVGAARSSIGIEREFTSLLPYLKETLKLNMLANDCQLSLVDASLQVVGQQKKSPGDDDVDDTSTEEEMAVVEKVMDVEDGEIEEISDAVNGINIE